jgi:hypothetical protein
VHAPPAQREQLERGLDEEAHERVPFDVGVDGEGLTRRIRAVDATSAGRETVTIDFSDFGADLGLERPPDDQVLSPEEWAEEPGDGVGGYSIEPTDGGGDAGDDSGAGPPSRVTPP